MSRRFAEGVAASHGRRAGTPLLTLLAASGSWLRPARPQKRLFVLTDTYLVYFDGTDIKSCTEKGKINLRKVIDALFIH